MRTVIIAIIVTFVVSFLSCRKDDKDQDEFTYNPTHKELDLPGFFPKMKIPSENPLTEEGVSLGRKLYYDPLLHPDQTMSCSNCHDQTKAFTTYESNSLAHINLGWNHAYLWNGKISGSLEDIMMFEVEDFFGTDVSLFNNNAEYKTLFKKAFNVDEITTKELAYALAQFFRTLNSYRSKYDQRMGGTTNFTEAEWKGYDIFFSEKGDCFHCHGTVLFHDNEFHNNALDENPAHGLFAITGDSSDIGKFKTPTLRNIELTAPYMHDGRYQTLEEVIDFYSEGLKYSPTVDPLMKNVNEGGTGGVYLTEQEKQDLIAFLKTLTDQEFTTDPELSEN